MNTKIVAHRGASSLAAENTLGAFESAIGLGVDMVEFDVRRTLDGELITFHDAHYQTTPISEWTYSELVAIHDDPQHVPPRLREVLQVVAGRVGLDVELKEGGYEAEVLQLLDRYVPSGEYVITSFLDDVVAKCKKLRPEVRVGLLLGHDQPASVGSTRLSELFPFTRVANCNADFIAPHLKLVSLGLLPRAVRRHVPSFVWTVNTPELITRFLDRPGIEAIITDVPDVAIALRDRTAHQPGRESRAD